MTPSQKTLCCIVDLRFRGQPIVFDFIVWIAVSLVCLSHCALAQPSVAEDLETKPSAAAALATVFSPSAAPARKTMGLLQRSFVEVAQQTADHLEIALVIDGTSSMEAEIEGVKQSIGSMMDDLQRGRRGEVRMAIIVYRDSGSPSGITQVLLDRFTTDQQTLVELLDQIIPETGAPFYHEMIDAGVHVALDQLPWSEDTQTTRWVFLVGDAPPYPENFSSTTVPLARRAYATDQLIALAARKEIQIHCLLCTSTAELQTVYQQALPEAQQFMNALSAGTGGLMLDLSYSDVRKAILEAGKQPRFDYLEIAPITQQDLTAAIETFPTPNAESNLPTSQVQVAVLPHLPLQRMNFDSSQPAVQVATGLNYKLDQLPMVRVVSTYDIERQLRRVRAEGIREDQQIRALAARLQADYCIWGQLSPDGAAIQSAVYVGKTGDQLVNVTHRGDVAQLASVILSEPSADVRFASLQASPQGDRSGRLAEQLQRRLAKTKGATNELLKSLGEMEKVIGLSADDRQSDQHLETARATAEAVLVTEPKNGLALWLLANIHFNLATRAHSAGQVEQAATSMQEMEKALVRAYRDRIEIDSISLRGEIAADYHFLVERDIPKAIEYYETLATNPVVCSSVRRRAHWMLTGIYAGDWGVDQALLDPAKARSHAIAIMANWENSPEAKLLAQWLGWDADLNRTKHPYLPRTHGDLVGLMRHTQTPG